MKKYYIRIGYHIMRRYRFWRHYKFQRRKDLEVRFDHAGGGIPAAAVYATGRGEPAIDVACVWGGKLDTMCVTCCQSDDTLTCM